MFARGRSPSRIDRPIHTDPLATGCLDSRRVDSKRVRQGHDTPYGVPECLVSCHLCREPCRTCRGGVCWLGVHSVESLRIEVKTGRTSLKPKCGAGLRRRPKTHPVCRYRLRRHSDAGGWAGASSRIHPLSSRPVVTLIGQPPSFVLHSSDHRAL
jgi:hypothetical protein